MLGHCLTTGIAHRFAAGKACDVLRWTEHG
jgi:hypothetical protein